jgi:gamma-glutamyltranspeptidase/glutathione hydrolase
MLILLLAIFPNPALAQSRGAVATSEAFASVATAGILEKGGNAIDAAVAASFALAVTLPAAGNLGGGGFLLYRSKKGQSYFLDFREIAPAAAFSEMYLDSDGKSNPSASRLGWKAVGVPGSVFGMAEAHRRWGRLSWEQVLAPAIWLADAGFLISSSQAKGLTRVAGQLAKDPLAASIFLQSNGQAWSQGHRLRQPLLAATLRSIAKNGESVFRSGPVVEGILAASDAGGGILQAQDFRDYQPAYRPVHTFNWQGCEIYTVSPPSSGGIFLQQTLQSLTHPKLITEGPQSAWTIQCIGEATSIAFKDRNRWLGDPAGFDFPLIDLVAKDYLADRRKRISGSRFTRGDEPPEFPFLESKETTHYSVMDGEGGAVAVTTTLNGGYGAKVMAPGGFFMNNEMDDFAVAPGVANLYGLVQGKYNAVKAGRRPLSSMTPTIVVKNGRVDAVIGSPGGPTILTTVMQVLLNRYLFKMNPATAVAFPRFHRQDLPEKISFEAGRISSSQREHFRQLGQPIESVGGLGDVNAIFLWKGEWQAFADPRRQGLAISGIR